MADSEKITYKPVSVRDLLVEMKDISELMIDLAYSAALFNSKKLAEEVLELEERVDTLSYLLNMNAMLAARDAEDAEALIGVCTVASAADKISDAAADMATIVLRGIGIHPIIREAFERVEEHLTCVKVKPDSQLVGRKIGDLKLAAEIGVDLIAIRRGKRWMIDPEDEEVLREGDVLIARGAPKGVDELERIGGIPEDSVEEE